MSLQQAAGRRAAMGAGMGQVSSWSRDIRFASGMILLFFATTHFLNHAAGIAGVAAMEHVQEWRYWLWHSWAGTVALYGALIVHPFFALVRVAQRRTFKMPAREMLQIALGLAIPLFLIDHIVGTRVMGSFFHLDESYRAVLRRLWPGLAATQSLLLLLVWVHGIIGLHFTLRSRDGYQRWRDPFLLLAVLIPILALIGFAVGGREAGQMAMAPEVATDAQIVMFNQNVTWAKTVFYGLVGCFVAFVGIREIRVRTTRQITVRFVGHGVRKLAPGATVLEMFRRFGIPHAALCGGRARCATCRVLVLDGGDGLPPPGPNEAKLLRRIAAPDRVRLACQIRPRDDLQVQILLASRLNPTTPGQIETDGNIGKRGLTVVVADLRAFSALSARQLPQELIGLLNRFFDEMAQAITAHGGRIDAFYGDGFMAVFGLEGTPARSAQTAIAAAADIVRAVEALNREFGAALPLPLRIGIGIHSGQAITGAVENDSLGRRDITVGETVAVAAQLELATRRVLADILVSEDTIRASGRSYRGTTALKITIRGREKPLNAVGFASAPELADERDDRVTAAAVFEEAPEVAPEPVDEPAGAGGLAVLEAAVTAPMPSEAPAAEAVAEGAAPIARKPRRKASSKKAAPPDDAGA
ncbi:MAG TPA: adenylate/guanylate cyclase domain-containing protein [Bosea sp. (in: a-proteobacteria)]|uniref:adenylate/guanylate cyclase domain-containing protein n=1 Tax=Bosea sp. (in: a-proteobacteria) TaxID=1871050 RepID=UPI002DDCFB44|nr:adenylate/guanylate cyclase domain-containing protein [Bosea sp. (in: a-proteobacteria)]HEV2554969.1 adenylate/guanylate cyclase domain-containing protein [Bosea sp. (in: a-proteobacteria)]